MRVLFLPDHTDGNPYQRQLIAGLEAEGVDVTLASGYPLETIRAIGQSRPEVVHVHWVGPFIVGESLIVSVTKTVVLLLATLVGRSLGVGFVWTIHNLLEHERRHPRYERFVRRVYARLVDSLVVHCRSAVSEVSDEYGVDAADVVVVPHGHYCESYENTVDVEAAREELCLDGEALVFLSFGQIRPYKGITRLVRSFDEISDPEARLLVVGKATDQREAQRVERLARERPRVKTEFRFVPESEVQVYLNAADALVLPYRSVLTSGAAILGMSFGTPVVGPATGCIPEHLDEQLELLYDPERETVADAMRRAAIADLESIGERNRDKAKTFRWDSIAEATSAVYEQCSNGSSSAPRASRRRRIEKTRGK